MSVDTAAAASLAATIGSRIRRERLLKEWTLDRLADATGISRRQVVNLEQGESNPSISTLLKLSQALRISLSALVEAPPSGEVQITRVGHGARLWTGSQGGSGVLLASTTAPEVVELWEWWMNPGERLDSDAHPHGTRELLHVHTGVVTIRVGEQRHELHAGDAIMFPGDVPHAYSNEADASAHYSLSVYEPTPGQPHPHRSPSSSTEWTPHDPPRQ